MSTLARRDQLSRLLQILMAIRAGHPNARELADLCEVSPRTIYRDLDSLETSGVPIRYRAERQGYEIAPSFSMHVPQLSRTEGLALMLLARLRESDDSLLAGDARQAIGKVLACLPESERKALDELGKLIDVPDVRGPVRAPRGSVSHALFEGMSTRRRVRTWFEDGGSLSRVASVREEVIGPYRLVLSSQEWHVLGLSDAFGHPIVSLGLDAVRRAELTELPFAMPPDDEVRRLIDGAGLASGTTSAILVRVRAPRELAALVEGAVWHPTSRAPGGSEGDVILTLLTDCLSELGAYLADLGEGIEVISPPELRRRLEALRRRTVAGPGLAMVRRSPSAGDNT